MPKQPKKHSAAVGFNIRFAFNNEWRLANALGRTVAVRYITKEDSNFTQCEDCKMDSTLIVVELSRFTPKGKKIDHPLVWGWCGCCDIGQ